MTHLAVFACGNTSRGDDALGVRLLERLAAEQLPDIVTIEDFQLQIEHVFDLDGADLALFVDAGTGAMAPISFYEVHEGRGEAAATHALEPVELLAVFRRSLHRAPPPAFVLCVRGENFTLGEGMSAEAAERLESAWPLLRDLCRNADVAQWRTIAADFTSRSSAKNSTPGSR